MHISSSVGASIPFGAQPTSTTSNKLNTETKPSVRPVATEVEKEQSTNNQAQPSIVIDEQAIALFEQTQSSQLSTSKPNHESSSSASQDQPSLKNETAVASYQTVGNLAQRETVQQMLGVDLFA